MISSDDAVLPSCIENCRGGYSGGGHQQDGQRECDGDEPNGQRSSLPGVLLWHEGVYVSRSLCERVQILFFILVPVALISFLMVLPLFRISVVEKRNRAQQSALPVSE